MVKEVHEAFQRSRDLCLAELDEVRGRGGPLGAVRRRDAGHYFRTLDFSLGERQVAGLREFARRAADRGEVPALPEDGPIFAAV